MMRFSVTALLSLSVTWLAAAHLGEGGEYDRDSSRELWNSDSGVEGGFSCYDLENPCKGNHKTFLPSSKSPRHYIKCDSYRKCYEGHDQTCSQHSHDPAPKGHNVYCPDDGYCRHACDCKTYENDPDLCEDAAPPVCVGGDVPEFRELKSRQECCPCCSETLCNALVKPFSDSGTPEERRQAILNAQLYVASLQCDLDFFTYYDEATNVAADSGGGHSATLGAPYYGIMDDEDVCPYHGTTGEVEDEPNDYSGSFFDCCIEKLSLDENRVRRNLKENAGTLRSSDW